MQNYQKDVSSISSSALPVNVVVGQLTQKNRKFKEAITGERKVIST
jgi:hypothetical protein